VSFCSGHTSGAACTVDLSSGDGIASFTKPATTVTGTIVDEAGRRQPEIAVNLTGTDADGTPVSLQTTTDQNGMYDFGPPPGTYTVTPQVPSADTSVANGFRAYVCPGGRAAQGACAHLPVAPNATVVVKFVYGCGVEGDRLDTVEPIVQTESETQFGAIPGTIVTLTGKGFCPNMTVDFGNSLAEATVTNQSGTDIIDGGTKALVTVPRLATTGTVTVKSHGHTATLRHVAIDSFRNVYGFNFLNFSAPLTVQMFEHVFGLANTTEVVTANTCPPGNCPVKEVVMTPQAADAFVRAAIAFGTGNCFGISLGAARLANGGDLTPADLGETAESAWGITKDDNVGTFLDQQQLTVYSDQLSHMLIASYQADATLKGPELLSEIAEAIGLDAAGTDEYGTGAIISMWSGPPGHERAHAVLAYNVEKDASGQDNGTVDVYDSNTPYEAFSEQVPIGLVHADRMDKSRLFINPDGTWDFSGDKLAGYPIQIAVLPVSQVIAALNAGLSFVNPVGVVTVPGPGTVIDSVVAPDGSAVNLAQGSQGVVLNPTPDGTGAVQESFSGLFGTYVETLSGTGPLSETVDMQGFSATIDAGAGRDKVVIDTTTNTVSIGPALTGSPSATASITVDHTTTDGGLQTATVSGSPAAGPLTLGFTASGQMTVVASAHRARAVPLALTSQATGQVPQQFSTTVNLPAGNAASLLPNWLQLTGGSVVANVGVPGARTKPETLDNTAHAPAEPRVGRLRISGHTLLEPLALPALPPGAHFPSPRVFSLAQRSNAMRRRP
jgi:hypothetical protein